MYVTVDRGVRISTSTPKMAWDLDALRLAAGNLFSPLPDGRLLFIQKGPSEDDITSYDVVLNFSSQLTGRATGGRRR
jgi:hypothetical protein